MESNGQDSGVDLFGSNLLVVMEAFGTGGVVHLPLADGQQRTAAPFLHRDRKAKEEKEKNQAF